MKGCEENSENTAPEVDLEAGDTNGIKLTQKQKLAVGAIGVTVVLFLSTWASKQTVAATDAKKTQEQQLQTKPANSQTIDGFAKSIGANVNSALHQSDVSLLPCLSSEMGQYRRQGAGSTELCVPTEEGGFAWKTSSKLTRDDLQRMSKVAQDLAGVAGQMNGSNSQSKVGDKLQSGLESQQYAGYAQQGASYGSQGYQGAQIGYQDGQPVPAPVAQGSDSDTSNVVLSFRAEVASVQQQQPVPMATTTQTAAQPSGIERETRTAESDETGDGKIRTKPTVLNFNSATGDEYVVFEGTKIPCTLMNRLNGAFAGPIDCVVSEDILSHDHTRVLIPQGTKMLGGVTQVSSTTQERLFVAFHRMIMPDGFSVSLDQFKGLNQIGETALRDKVDHHYMEIFGVSIAIAAVSGLAQIGNYGTSAATLSVGSQYRAGVTQNLAENSMQVMNRFLNVLPTFIIREGSRVKVYVSQDFTLPDVNNHTIKKGL